MRVSSEPRGRGLRTEGWAGLEPGLRGVCPAGCLSPEAVDTLLQRCEGGVDAALQYAKNMAKYMKDLIGYLEKRSALGASWARGAASGWKAPPLTPALTPPPRLQRWTLPKVCRRSSRTADRASCRRWGTRGNGVGSLRPGCVSPLQDGPKERGFPSLQGQLRELGRRQGFHEGACPTPVTAGPAPTAAHAPPVHLLAGPGAGPGVRPRPGAGGGHAADPDLRAGELRPGGWAGWRVPGSPSHTSPPSSP